MTGTQLNLQMRLRLLQRLNSIQCVNLVDEVLNELFALAQDTVVGDLGFGSTFMSLFCGLVRKEHVGNVVQAAFGVAEDA